MTLDDLVKEAAARGDLRSLTLWTTPQGYQASVSRDGKSWRCEMAPDPVTALRRALGASGTSTDTKPQPDEDIFG